MNGKQFLALLMVCALAAFSGSVVGTHALVRASAQTPPLGNGGPTLCEGVGLACNDGAVALNPAASITWTALQTFPNIVDTGLSASDTCVATNASKQLIDGTGCGGGSTFTTTLTDTAQIQALGAGGANACAGTNYPATAYGYCAGANNGTNIFGAVFGPINTTFACTTSCTAGDSARAAFYDSTTSGAGGRDCDLWKVQASGLESSCGLIAGGSTGVLTSVLRNQVANDWNGTCASVATGPHCVTASRSGQTETGLTCFQLDVTNHAFAVDTGVTLSNAAAYTFTSTIPNGFVGSTSTASATTDTVTWFCFKP